MSTHRFFATAIALAAAAFTLPACKKASEAGAAASSSAETADVAPPSAPEDPARAADEALSAKLGYYIECINEVDPYVSQGHEYYVERLTDKHVFEGDHTPNVRQNEPRMAACFKAIEAAAAAPPKRPDLEQAALAYRAALETLEPSLADAYRYYDQRDYKDDNHAHGNALIPTILAGYEAFFAARDKLRAGLDGENRELRVRSLARLEKEEGKTLRYYTRRVMLDGEAALELALDPATDPAKLRDAIEAYKTLWAELLDRKAKHPEEAERGGGLGSFVGHGDLVLRDFKEMQRIAVAKLAGKPVELEDLRRKQLLEMYNSLVNDSNELEWKPAP
jgi:hypothetical protein